MASAFSACFEIDPKPNPIGVNYNFHPMVRHRNGALVDGTPETERELKSELTRIAKQFGGGDGIDMTKFPDFKFAEPQLDAINASADDK